MNRPKCKHYTLLKVGMAVHLLRVLVHTVRKMNDYRCSYMELCTIMLIFNWGALCCWQALYFCPAKKEDNCCALLQRSLVNHFVNHSCVVGVLLFRWLLTMSQAATRPVVVVVEVEMNPPQKEKPEMPLRRKRRKNEQLINICWNLFICQSTSYLFVSNDVGKLCNICIYI